MGTAKASRCQCDALTELAGVDAYRYIDEHLGSPEPGLRASGWEKIYACQVTPWVWLQDWPHSERHGGGVARLRRFARQDLPPAADETEPRARDRDARRILAVELARDATRQGASPDTYVVAALRNVASTSAFMREAGARVLGEHAPAGAAAALAPLLDDESPAVARAAQNALQRLAARDY